MKAGQLRVERVAVGSNFQVKGRRNNSASRLAVIDTELTGIADRRLVDSDMPGQRNLAPGQQNCQGKATHAQRSSHKLILLQELACGRFLSILPGSTLPVVTVPADVSSIRPIAISTQEHAAIEKFDHRRIACRRFDGLQFKAPGTLFHANSPAGPGAGCRCRCR